jgi:hypothetical protein
MYHYVDQINHQVFFWFRRDLIENMNWARLSTASKAVFPVICSFTNKNGVAFPSEETITSLCMRSEKDVRKGILGLSGFPGFRWEYYVTKRGRRAKRFRVNLPRESGNGQAFPFHRALLESGNWRELTPAGKACYPVLRHFAYFDHDAYRTENDLEDSFDEIYGRREYEFADPERLMIARYAGIHRSSVGAALESLESCNLVEPIMEFGFRVYLRGFR